MPLIMRSPVSSRSSLGTRGFGELHILPVGNIAPFARLQHRGHEPGRSAGLHTRAGRPQYLGSGGKRRPAPLHLPSPRSLRPISGVVLCPASPSSATRPRTEAAERFDIMDFNAVGSLRVEGGDQLLHRRRPAGKVAAEVSAQGVTILRQTRRQRHIKEKSRTGRRRPASARRACLRRQRWSTDRRAPALHLSPPDRSS